MVSEQTNCLVLFPIIAYGILLTIFVSDKLVRIMGNASSQGDLEAGDVIYRPIENGLYSHYGVYVGDGYVIHLVDTGILRESLEAFAGKSKVSIKR